MCLSNWLQTDFSNQVLLAIVGQGAAKISEAKVGGREKNFQRGPIRIRRTRGQAELADFLSISNFDLRYFCSLLTYKDVQYLI